MNCNNIEQNDDYENARRIIIEAQKKIPRFGCCSFPNTTGSVGPTAQK